jgi:hypothetical protein
MMTDDPTTPPPAGQPQALTDDELDSVITTLAVNCMLSEADAARLLATLDDARARAAHFESLAKDQQVTNEAMVASLQRGLAQLEASEAEVARLREAYLRLARGRALSDHWNTCGGCGPNAEGCLRSAEQDARETLAAYRRLSLGRVPKDES